MMREFEPYRFDPVNHLLWIAFMNEPKPGLISGSMDRPEASVNGALIPPLLSQLAAIRAGSVYFGSLY